MTRERLTDPIYFRWAIGGGLAEETDGNGTTIRRYERGVDGTTIAQESVEKGIWSQLLTDSHGSIGTHVADDGTVQEQAAFTPYGAGDPAGSRAWSGAPGSAIAFQGDMADRLTGALLLGERQYDPGTARFTTPDTYLSASLDLGLALDPLTGNPYLFAGANPVSFFDDGHGSVADRYSKEIQQAAREFGISERLLRNLIRQEGPGQYATKRWLRVSRVKVPETGQSWA